MPRGELLHRECLPRPQQVERAVHALAAIAVPILDGRRVHGALNLLWTRQAFTVEEFAARHLADLHAAVDEIVNSLNIPRRGATPRAPGRS